MNSTGWRQIIFFLFVIVALSIIVNLSKGIVELLQARERITMAEQEVAMLETEYKRLLDQVTWHQTESFKEREIRDKLFMAQPGDIIIDIPKEAYDYQAKLAQAEGKRGALPHWKKWMTLLLRE